MPVVAVIAEVAASEMVACAYPALADVNTEPNSCRDAVEGIGVLAVLVRVKGLLIVDPSLQSIRSSEVCVVPADCEECLQFGECDGDCEPECVRDPAGADADGGDCESAWGSVWEDE